MKTLIPVPSLTSHYRRGRRPAVLAAVAALLATAGTVSALNLVQNPGFETGNLSGWTLTPAADASALQVVPAGAHSGAYAALFGASGSLNDSITQVLSTTPGTTYTFSFWLRDNYLQPDDRPYLTASWNGGPVLDITPADASTIRNWTEFSFTETATSASTSIGFAGRNWYFIKLDDVSVTANPGTGTPVPDPASTGGLQALGLLALWGLKKRQAAGRA